MKKQFLCISAVLCMQFCAPALRAEDADVSRILRFAYSRTNSVVEIVNPDKDKRPPKQISPNAPNPVETIEVPRKGSLTVAFDDHNPFLFDLASANVLTDSAGLTAFRALLTDLESGTKALVKSTGGVAIQNAGGIDINTAS
jgi:hypothetical protein